MLYTISKSDFLKFLECPRYAWLCKNRPDLLDKNDSRIIKQGKEVEKIAHGLFAKGVEVAWDNAIEQTQTLLQNKTPVIYQATFRTANYLARADILVKDPDGQGWHLYEVKSCTKVKPEHLADLCFQANVLEACQLRIYSYNLIHVNKDYLYDETKGLEVEKFLKIKNLTQKITEKQSSFRESMLAAHTLLTSPNEPHPKLLVKKLKYPPSKHFLDYYWQGVPDYSIYDIAGLVTKKQLTQLVDQGIMAIENIPDGFFKNQYQNLQVQVTKSKTPHIDQEKLTQTLAQLQYPLYFLDYESVAPAIPLFHHTRPYQHICFQYSLHVQRTPESKLEHYEYLHVDKDNPTSHLLKKLQAEIGTKGSVLVWHENFEKSRNNEMAEDYPEYQNFLNTLNTRIFDLKKIFDEGIYEDYRFKGSCSLKNVLPVLVPELSYDELAVKQGMEAMGAWQDLIEGKVEDRDKAIQDMLIYCGQDTEAMVRILKHFILHRITTRKAYL